MCSALCWPGFPPAAGADASYCGSKIWTSDAASRSTRAFWRRTWPGWGWIGTKAAGEAGRTAPIFKVNAANCTHRADLHAASAPHLSDGAVLYGGRCARLSPAEADALRRRRAPALRIAVPEESVSFTDGHLGHFSQNLARECGDFILRRSDGIYAYQLAVAVDDARMGVTQVVRGQDLLSSTPRQIFLQRLLGLPTPEYYHLPLLVNAEGVRLSKREKSLDMGALRARFTPAELTGWLAFLAGQQPAPEPVPLRSLAACFSWEKVPRRDITVPARLLNEERAE